MNGSLFYFLLGHEHADRVARDWGEGGGIAERDGDAEDRVDVVRAVEHGGAQRAVGGGVGELEGGAGRGRCDGGLDGVKVGGSARRHVGVEAGLGLGVWVGVDALGHAGCLDAHQDDGLRGR